MAILGACSPCAAMETSLLTPSLAELRSRLPGLMPRDRQRLGRRADGAAALRDAKPREQALARLNAEIETAAARVEERRGAVPDIAYPPELPVSQRKAEIAAAIRDHQVVIVAGETGSGKTTQLPKICLELGRGVTGQIGHTQPRRIAARTVAERIAEELGTEVGTAVGFKVRFTDKSSDGTFIKVMTDGILLTEMQRRPAAAALRHADHRRGARAQPEHRLPPRLPQAAAARPAGSQGHHHLGHDRPGAVRKHFGDAPVIEVSGRTYPVEVRYRPLADPDRPRRRAEGPGPGHLRRDRRAAPRRPRRRAGLPQRRARDQGHRRRPGRPGGPDRPGGAAALRPAVRGRAAPRVPAAPAAARGAGHQRRGDVADRAGHPVRGRPRHRADLPLQPAHQGAAAADRARSRGRRRTSARAGAAGPPTASASGCTARRTSRRGRSSPTRRSCAPTWPRSSCRRPRSTSVRSRTSRSWTRPTPATSPTASGCWRSWARSPPDGARRG